MKNKREKFFEKDSTYKKFEEIDLPEDFVKNFQDKVPNSGRVTEKEIIEVFSSPWYNTVDFGNDFIHLGNFKMDSYFPKYKIPDIKDKRVIDLGANEGIFSFEMERLKAKEVVACELFMNNIIKMEFLKKLKGSKIRIEQLDMFSSDFSVLGQFDVVLCSHVIGHVGRRNPVNNVKKQDLLRLCWDLCSVEGTIIIAACRSLDADIIKNFFIDEDCKKIISFRMNPHGENNTSGVSTSIFHIKKSLNNLPEEKKK